MYDKTKRNLIDIIQLLENDNPPWIGWIKFFKKALNEFEKGNYKEFASIIKSGSGGMGSLNDIVLGQSKDENGNFIWNNDAKKLNEQFLSNLEALYEFAFHVKKKE